MSEGVLKGERRGLSAFRSTFFLALLFLFSEPAKSAEITSVSPINCSPTGGRILTLSGSALGLRDIEAHARVGGTRCQTTEWKSGTSITCKVGRGVARSSTVVATIEGVSQLGNAGPVLASVFFTYDQVELRNILAVNGATATPTVIKMTLANLGNYDATPVARLGGSASQSTKWTSDTAVSCVAPLSTNAANSVVVTLQSALSTILEAYTFDRPAPAEITPSNSLTFGGRTISVIGGGFGVVDTSPAVRAGATGCTATQWVSDSTVRCKLGSDTNSNLDVLVTVGRVVKRLVAVLSYDDPLVTGFSPTNSPHSAARLLLITGANFGSSRFNPRATRVGDTSCVDTLWTSDTSISCTCAPGFASALDVWVMVANVYASRPGFSYDRPQITALERSNGPASGNQAVLLIGSSFGVFGLTPMVTVGGTVCPQTEWVSSSTLSCKSPSAFYTKWFPGSSADVSATIGPTFASTRDGFTFDPACVGPCVLGLSCPAGLSKLGCTAPAAGDARHSKMANAVLYDNFQEKAVLRIQGNFSLGRRMVTSGNSTVNSTNRVQEEVWRGDVSIVFGGIFTCEPISPSSQAFEDSTIESYLDCVLPAGVGYAHGIQVTVRNATNQALLDGCLSNQRDKTYGTQMWPPPGTLDRVTGLAITPKPYGSCYLPSGVPDDAHFAAEDAGLSLSYHLPQITAISPAYGSNMRGETANITIYGKDFGVGARELWETECRTSTLRACKLLFSNSVSLFNVSCNSIDLLVPESDTATGGDVEAALRAKRLVFCDESSLASSYMVQCGNAFAPSNSFCVDRCSSNQAWRKCGRRCPEGRVKCDAPLLGGVQEVSLVIGGSAAAPSLPTPALSGATTFSYAAPNIWSIAPSELLSGTSSLLTITGQNFGTNLAVEYAGRLFTNDVSGNQVVERMFDENLLPKSPDSIAWWDWAQYQACFSTSSSGKVASSEAKRCCAKSLLVGGCCTKELCTQMEGCCDYGVVYSSGMTLRAVVIDGVGMEQLVVQSPPVLLPEGSNEVFVDVFAQVMSQRSVAKTGNSSIAFRVACTQINPSISLLISQWHLSTSISRFTARSSFTAISHRGRILVMGGTTAGSPEITDVYGSAFHGGGSYSSVDADVLWWEARTNISAVVHKDILFVMGGGTGTAPAAGNPGKCFKDVWVYAESQEVADAYILPSTPVVARAAGEAYRAFWIQLPNAPWAARTQASALAFKGRVYLVGGVLCSGVWTSDVWSSQDMRTWRLDTSNAGWQGRNSLLATVHNSRMYVMGSVQKQFYNTFSSSDGTSWSQMANACALTAVDVQQVVSYGGLLMAFTLGCHDRSTIDEAAVSCDADVAGPLQNRIHFSTDGRTWSLALSHFEINQFSRAVPVQMLWAGALPGEFRYDYSVVVHADSLFIIAGKALQAPRDAFGNYFRLADGSIFKSQQFKKDIWISKGLMPATRLCNERSDAGIKASDIAAIKGATLSSRECNFRWTLDTVSRLGLYRPP